MIPNPEFVKQALSFTSMKQIKTSGHALDQLNERGIAIEECIDAILNGKCYWQEAPGQDRNGKDYRWPKLHFKSTDDRFTVVVGLTYPLSIITAFYG